ncbi:MAG: hypothetical protein D6681_01000 [Calditrichaeota bacterium]|nr:MAG: hypothetical protein D6681_01000 [Calditrichota bacterium]
MRVFPPFPGYDFLSPLPPSKISQHLIFPPDTVTSPFESRNGTDREMHRGPGSLEMEPRGQQGQGE